MLAFFVLGVLERTKAFPRQDLTPELVDSVVKIYGTTVCFYDELPPLLTKKGRPDLAAVIERKIAEYERRKERNELYASVAAIGKRIDRQFFNGSLLRMKRKILHTLGKR
jgi:hypothetical protein